MIKNLLNYLENKKILILGFGIEGISSYNFLRRNFKNKKIFIADKKNNLLEEYPYLFQDSNVQVNMGDNYLNGIEEYDLILKAPGISLKDIDTTKFKNKITSQLELFFEFINVFSIGVTGTKGKSTTSSLIYNVIKNQGKEVFLLGNIGEPIFNEIEQIKEKSIVVLELSSHALEYVKNSPNIAIMLNIYEEHLDYYKSLDKYIEAKFNISKYQKEEDYFIYNFDNDIIKKYNFKKKKNDYLVKSCKENFEESIISLKDRNEIDNNINNNINNNIIYIKDNYIYYNENRIMSISEEMNLKGKHNINNIMFVLAVCCILKLNINTAIDSIKKFKPLQHRMEYVRKVNGIEYYNDSIATIPEATINSIEALKNVDTLIVGGKDRGIDLNCLIKYIKDNKINNIICLPKTGEYIYRKLKESNKNIFYTESLEEAVEISNKVTEKEKICLLSPAASSYGYFKNFEERGNLFKKYVNNIISLH